MSVVDNPAIATPASPADPAAAKARERLHVADVLLAVSVALWAYGVARTNTGHLGDYGLLNVLPIAWYAGLALLVVSAGVELAQRSPSRVRMAAHAVALVVMLYGTAPIVYPDGRYSWLYKTIGVVQYVNAHGQLDRYIDIYQNWPGFFALAAWFDKVAGVASPLVYAKWAQLIFELAALPLLSLAYSALGLPVRQRWIALLLYSASNWIGQDYLSPQGLGTLLSLGIMAIALRWMFAGNSAGLSRLPRRRDADVAGEDAVRENAVRENAVRWRAPRREDWPQIVLVLLLVYFVLTFTHELSPYLVMVQLGALGLVGLVRPRWIPVALAAVAVGYLLPRFTYVNDQYGLLRSIGSFFSNLAPPSSSSKGWLPVPASQRLIQHASAGLSLIIWALGLVGAWMRRRSRRTVLALLILAYSPILILAAGAYGNEAILRVYMFSLPWAAALAAAALAPLPVLANGRATEGRDGAGSRQLHARQVLGKLRAPIAMLGALALFLPAFFGADRANAVTPSEVATIAKFLQLAPPGPIFSAADGAPLGDTSRYNLFPVALVFGSSGVIPRAVATPDIAATIARQAESYTNGRQPAYVIVSPSMIAYNKAYPATPNASFSILLASLARSGYWKLVVANHGTVIYELPPVPFHLAPGPTNPNVIFGVT